jgi:hypothetical protein
VCVARGQRQGVQHLVTCVVEPIGCCCASHRHAHDARRPAHLAL